VPYFLALCAAFTAALGAAFQDREIDSFSDAEAKGLHLLLAAIRRPMWWLGLVVLVGAPIFQYLALRVGNLTQVQPVVTTELLFILAIIVVTHKQHPGRLEWLGASGIVAGLVIFLVTADSTGTQTTISQHWAIVITLGAIALVGGFWGFAHFSKAWMRAALLGAAAATCFAYQAAMTQIVAGVPITSILTQPALLGLALAGISGFLFFEHALRAGHIAASRASMVVVDPLLSVTIGVVVFNDKINHGPVAITLEVLGLLVMCLGAWRLATSPMIAETGAPKLERAPAVETTVPEASSG
jgi:drug/metabolite transporter (DMT)-like permease